MASSITSRRPVDPTRLEIEARKAQLQAKAGWNVTKRNHLAEVNSLLLEQCDDEEDYFLPLVFDWPHHERTLWADFADLKTAASVDFPGAFHRFRFGFANANVDSLDPDLLQKLMRHQAASTTRRCINAAERMRRAGTAGKIHFPDVLKVATA